MEANTFITKWEYRYEANLSIDAINELGSQGWELFRVWDSTYMFKRMALDEWNLDGYKATALKPTKQGEPASIKPFEMKKGNYYTCIKELFNYTVGKVYKATDNDTLESDGEYPQILHLAKDCFRPATAEEIVKAEAHKAGYDFKMESDNQESDDEKIRKRIIHALHGDVLSMAETNQALAWLEKQGDQKPIEWNEYDQYITNVLIRRLKDKRDIHGHATFSINTIDITNTIEWLESLQNRCLPQPKQEWSKEDEENLQSVIEAISATYKWDRIINWLKSLRNRCVIKPKQEWGEEDDRMFQHCVAVLSSNELYKDDEKEPIYDWLKSLHPQKQWKPSKVQINSLERVLDFYGKGSRIYTSVEKLLKQLKAL